MRLRISENILSFSNHIKSFNDNKIAKVWVLYVEDENPAVRFNIAAGINGMLTNKVHLVGKSGIPAENDMPDSLDEFVDLLINTIATSLLKALKSSNHALHDTLLVTARNCAR